MCTRRNWPTAPVGLLFVLMAALFVGSLLSASLCARPALAGPIEDWQEREDAVLVVILLDGLVAGFVEGVTADGDPLMPATAQLLRSCRRYADVLVPTTNAAAAREEIATALESFSARPVRRIGDNEDDPGSLATELASELASELTRTAGRQVVLVDLDWLVPPLTVEAEMLTALDPAPWSSLGMTRQIEDQVQKRLKRVARLAPMQGRGAARGSEPLIRDVRWVVQAAHRAIDAQLAQLIDAFTTGPLAGRSAVVLTATSSMGMGARGPLGLHQGAQLDQVQVPVYLWGAGVMASTDDAGRQWGNFDADWFGGPPMTDRFTWAWTAAEAEGDPASGALRWTTEAFTLIDVTSPYRSAQLYDRQLDPGEWLDQRISHAALADSLRRELRAKIYGPAPTMILTGGADGLTLSISSRVPLQGPAGRSLHPLLLAAGETVRIIMPDGAEDISFGRAVEIQLAGGTVVLEKLVVHSPHWRAAFSEPGNAPGLKLRIE